MKEIYIDI